MSEIFRAYLERQYRRSGAVAPHDRLQVVEDLLDKARSRGVFPVSETVLGRVDPDHPAVKAILDAPPEVTGSSRKSGLFAIQEKFDMKERPKWQQALILLGIVVAIMGSTLGIVWFRAARRHARAATTPTPKPTVTMNLAAPSPTVVVYTATPLPSPTPLPPTSTPTPTPIIGEPAEDPAAPVSLEIIGPPLPVYKAELDDQGRWRLPANAVQWLPDSYIRKVFAVGPALSQGWALQTGQRVRVHTRGGYVEEYVLTRRIVNAPGTQVELMQGSRPSVLVVLPHTDSTEVWLAELPEAITWAHMPPEAKEPAWRAVIVVEGAHVREAPSIHAKVLHSLPLGTLLELTGQYVQGDAFVWYAVKSPYSGWVAQGVIRILDLNQP